ncbi:hypothetical protein SBOR_5311 [Sclerotinia borealis F-4128]|uniref:Uncharacterized protein n=1 Tax=Sclerotinia borealis (strain F-4128) TaxID=1432307 RepID=W9CII5_SCLBF|nr:hypothetical protein SBOR_5311 [Sclerotinia borealis F-4128]
MPPPHTHLLGLTRRVSHTPLSIFTSLPTRTSLSHLISHPHPRPFTTTHPLSHPRKDSQDKNSINTESTEYSKSGTDDAAAREEEAAFDPNTTRPETEKAQAGKGAKKEGEGNPLEVSPANTVVSEQKGGRGGGAERSAGGKEGSGRSEGKDGEGKGKEGGRSGTGFGGGEKGGKRG